VVPLSDHIGVVDPSPALRHRSRCGLDPPRWWLVAVAAGGELFAATHAFIASPIGILLLFLWSVAFFYHLCSGIRHLAWDAGYGFEIRDAYRSGYAVLAATAVLTVLAWLYVLLA
jgi:succinate dehydrogenase cytochrome b subunit